MKILFTSDIHVDCRHLGVACDIALKQADKHPVPRVRLLQAPA